MVSSQFSCAARRGLAAILASGVGFALAPTALAGGTPETTLVVINPGSAESMYLGNYYKNARGIPDRNVVYIDPAPAVSNPGSPSYADFIAPNSTLDAVLGQLKVARIDDHIDCIVIASGANYYVDASGYVTDSCSPVTRFSQSAIFTMAYIKSQITAGNLPSGTFNQYSSGGGPLPFSSHTSYLNGSPSTAGAARRYFVCAQLGYTGPLGNTTADITAMVDRSVAADGTHPTGTFYFMNTTDTARNVRSPQFPAAETAIMGAGGNAMTLNSVLPDGMTDCLGIMTGWPDPPVDGSIFTLLPGSFADHLTSYAADFNNTAQTKCSAWIRRGASGSSGEVEEPCNYVGKFVLANFHNLYFRGMALGEAWLRSMQYVPFQGLLLGDPLCRPFAAFSTVQGNAPTGLVSSPVQFVPAATTPTGVTITSYELYIDGVFHSRHNPGESFTVNPLAIPGGAHEWRVLAYDSTPAKTVSVWAAPFSTSLFGRAVTANLTNASGDVTTLYQVTASANQGPVSEMRLTHNGRVIAATTASSATLSFYGRNIGTGQSKLQVEVQYPDGRLVRSTPMAITVSSTVGTISGNAPVAYSYTKNLIPGNTAPVELPAKFDDPLANATWTVVTPPAHATIGTDAKGYRVVTPNTNACGPDSMTFTVTTPSGTSNTATVSLVYGNVYPCPADINNDGLLDILDFTYYLQTYAAGDLRADMNGDCALNVADFTAYLQAFATGCP